MQLLYAGEGEARRPGDEGNTLPGVDLPQLTDKPGTQSLKGHEFVSISYHMPTTCEVCSKQLWHMFRPSPALECRSAYYIYHNYLFVPTYAHIYVGFLILLHF